MSDQVSHPYKTTYKIIVPYLNLCILGGGGGGGGGEEEEENSCTK